MTSSPSSERPIADERASRAEPSGEPNTSGDWWLAPVVVLLVAATLIGELLSPALHGWRAGIGGLITVSERSAAIATQTAAVAGCAVGFRLLGRVLREARLSVLFRIGIAPLAAAIITTVMASAARALPPHLTLGLSVLSALVVLAAAVVAVLTPPARGVALCLGLVGFSALLNGGARYLAVRASHLALASLFEAARAMATVAWLLLVLSAALAVVWLAQRRLRRFTVLAAGTVAVGVIGTTIAALGSAPDAPDWAALVTRALSQTARHPLPYIPGALQGGLELVLLGIAVVATGAPWKSALSRTALALALLSRAATDIPLLALAMTLAALAAPLASVEKR